MKQSRFDYFDVVRLRQDSPGMPQLAGVLGVVIGITAGAESKREYVVWVYGFDEIYSCLELKLDPTPFRDWVDDRRFNSAE
jgi:hypothetical protein